MHWRIFAALVVGGATAASAAQYPLTVAEAQMFGDIETITAHGEDTLPDLARRYGLGYEEILRANPGVDTWLPGEGTTIVIPGQRLLPPSIREGIVGNLTDRARLGFVIDFIQLHAGQYHWPTFNVADASISFGALLLAYDLIFAQKKEKQERLTKEGVPS